MSFWGSDFIFDDISSDTYGIKIGSINYGGVEASSGSSDVEIINQKVYRKSKPYFYGTQQSPVLEFPISFFSENELSITDSQVIDRWLFGHQTYKKLQIIQGDLQPVYYNCILKSPKKEIVGNIVRGMSCIVSCDSPFAWEFPKTKTITFSSSPNDYTYNFWNTSDDNDYNYPSLKIVSDNGGILSIKNVTDNNRIFYITNMAYGEILNFDNYHQIMSSSTGLLKLNYFNKNWFRVLPGLNVIKINGSISELELSYQFARKTGG